LPGGLRDQYARLIEDCQHCFRIAGVDAERITIESLPNLIALDYSQSFLDSISRIGYFLPEEALRV